MIILLLLTLLIYFVSRFTIKEIFIFFRKIFPSNKPVYALLSLIYLPGTLVHETAHFVTALLLLLPVKSLSLFPSFTDNEIKLGEVRYEKRDFIRGALVGIAPYFFGLGILSAIFIYNQFPNSNFWLSVLYSYLIFSISSNMFSSKKDLEGIILILPVAAIILIIFYIFDIKLNLDSVMVLLDKINHNLLFVLGINIFIFLAFKLLNKK